MPSSKRAMVVLAVVGLLAALLPAALGWECCGCIDTRTCATQASGAAPRGYNCGSGKSCYAHDNTASCWTPTQAAASRRARLYDSTCTKSSGGDPIINTFMHSSYELVGEAGKWYNLISETTHNINIHLKSANLSTKASGGTLIDAVALLYKGQRMEMSVDDAGDMTVAINSVIITKADLLNAPNNAKEVMLDDETAVVIELYREHFGHSIHIITPVFDATFFATMPGLDDYYQEYLTAYLNFYMGLRDPSISAIHGLLGQTAPNSMASKPRSAIASSSASIELFNGEDQEADYIVDGPFATEYKFTQYGKPPTKQQVLKVARRSLLEHLQPTVFATMKLHA